MNQRIARTILLLIVASVLFLSGCGRKQTATEEQKQDPPGNAAVEAVTTDDFTMEYCKFGDGEKTLLILPGLSIQSVMGSADAIAEAYQQFTEAYTVYVFDTRKDLPQSFTVYDAAEDTAAALSSLGLEDVSLFGVSYGGMEALEIAIQHPELVEKMVLVSTSANLTEEEFKTVENWIRLAEEGDTKALYLAFGEALYPPEVFEQSRDLLTEAAKTVTDEDLTRFVVLAEGMRGFDVSDDFDGIQCPVLVLGDKQDRVLGAEATEAIIRNMEQRADFASYLYDGYGHAVYDLAPDFKDRMLDFLQ